MCVELIFVVRKLIKGQCLVLFASSSAAKCSPAVLGCSVPSFALYGLASAERTLHCLQECEEYVQQHLMQYGKANRSSVLELLLSFFAEYAAAIRKWSEDRSNGSRQAAHTDWHA